MLQLLLAGLLLLLLAGLLLLLLLLLIGLMVLLLLLGAAARCRLPCRLIAAGRRRILVAAASRGARAAAVAAQPVMALGQAGAAGAAAPLKLGERLELGALLAEAQAAAGGGAVGDALGARVLLCAGRGRGRAGSRFQGRDGPGWGGGPVGGRNTLWSRNERRAGGPGAPSSDSSDRGALTADALPEEEGAQACQGGGAAFHLREAGVGWGAETCFGDWGAARGGRWTRLRAVRGGRCRAPPPSWRGIAPHPHPSTQQASSGTWHCEGCAALFMSVLGRQYGLSGCGSWRPAAALHRLSTPHNFANLVRVTAQHFLLIRRGRSRTLRVAYAHPNR